MQEQVNLPANHGDVREALNANAADAESRLVEKEFSEEFRIKSLSQLGTPVGGRYQLPKGNYIFYPDLDFAGVGIELVDLDGFYRMRSIAYKSLSYSGTDPFIMSGNTGQLLDIRELFLITPNATAIHMTNGNSLIIATVVFICEKPVFLDTMDFLSVFDSVPIVGSGTGFECIDVGVATLVRPQWNNGLNTGGIAFTFSGANSVSLTMTIMDVRLAASESFIYIDPNYGGGVSFTGGSITGGSAFAPGSRDQTDVSITSTSVVGDPGIPNSKIVGSVTVQNNVTVTALTQNVWTKFDFNGGVVATEGNEGFTLVDTTTGALRLDALNIVGSIIATISGLGAGGSSTYEFRAVVDGVPLTPVSIISANELSSSMSATPFLSDVSMVQNQVVELEVRNISNNSDFTGAYVTIIVK